MKSSNELLSGRFADSLAFAFELHIHQVRKGTRIPYFSHLMSVAALVLENGGDEALAIAALLHDAVEDQGGLDTLEVIRKRYGERVAHIVHGCTDTTVVPKPPWRQRKENYLTHLRTADPDVHLVSLADKLHNARTITADLQRDGSTVWNRFHGRKAGTLWYYRALADIFIHQDRFPVLAKEFNWVVCELERIAAETS